MTHEPDDDTHDEHEEIDHGHDHDIGNNDNDRDHKHDQNASPSDVESRARALQSLLIEKGVVTTDAIDEVIAAYETEIGPLNGARVVARAWTDESFKSRLLADARSAIEEFDFPVGIQHVEVVENTPTVHNVVVCTLCSCYPWSLLGLPPTWYKSHAYRSRTVREPRAVLEEFGVDLDNDVEVRIWDSSSEMRYMVLPQRPCGTEGASESELVDRVSRNSMIGVERLGE